MAERVTYSEFTDKVTAKLDFSKVTLLVDGVELGGVATFLGSGEQSNMSLFI
ncbi:MAG: hypothetical protein ACI4DU_10805 [Lachnospiraceae bacterium]